MTRIVAFIFALLLSITLVGCVDNKERPHYYEQMTLLDNPIMDNGYHFTHSMVLNEYETLYYAPLYMKIDIYVYTNDYESYVIRKTVAGPLGYKSYNYDIADNDMLKMIFGG